MASACAASGVRRGNSDNFRPVLPGDGAFDHLFGIAAERQHNYHIFRRHRRTHHAYQQAVLWLMTTGNRPGRRYWISCAQMVEPPPIPSASTLAGVANPFHRAFQRRKIQRPAVGFSTLMIDS